MVHGFCPNCSLFVSLFDPAIQLFRIQRTNSQLIHCNSRTILLIAVTWLAFPVILSVQRVFVANSLQTFKLVSLLYVCLYLLRALRPSCTYNLFNCRYLFGSRREPLPPFQKAVLFTPCLVDWLVGVCFWHKSICGCQGLEPWRLPVTQKALFCGLVKIV